MGLSNAQVLPLTLPVRNREMQSYQVIAQPKRRVLELGLSPGLKLLEREEPKSQLEQALAAARTGRGRIVSVEGEAGIGKTSLVLRFAEAHRNDARVYVSCCEHLATPEPLGPLRDIARDSHGRFSVSATSQLATYEALLPFLTSGRDPAVLLIEDIHWADAATLDLLRYLGRRIGTAPILIVVTLRSDEPSSQPRLAALWADMPRDRHERIEVQPLSPAAVSVLASQSGRPEREIFETTGGNPFHVIEFLATDGSSVPHRVRDATLARTSRLSSHARRTLECASIFPRQIRQDMLSVLAEDASHAGVEECMRAGMLNATGEALAFRHELVRRAVHDAISPLRLRELHAASLAMLKARQHVTAVELAHHAQEAGAMQDLVVYSLRAADEADTLGTHQESIEHLARALEHGTWLSNVERAYLLQRHFNAKIALARVRIRTGVPENGVLDEARAMPTSLRDIMHRVPLAIVDAEALWLGLPRPGALERLRAAFETALCAQEQHWALADAALWLKILGEPVQVPDETLSRLRSGHRAGIVGEWREAARAWSEMGCIYEQAIALSMGDDAAQREALALFDGLGAAPATARLRRQMRARGARAIPRGPIARTRASIAGLTWRQSQVLALLVEGLTNAQIAVRICVSPKTTEHHVSAIMARLGVGTRREAAEAARKRGLLSRVKNRGPLA